MFIILTIISFFFFFFIIFALRSRKPPCSSPPSPPGLPLIGNLHQLGSLPHRSLHALSKKYGPVMLLHLGSAPTVIISSAEMACEAMRMQDLSFASRPRSVVAKKLLYDCDMGFAPYGEYWRQARKLSVTHLLSLKMVQSFHSVREEEVSLMIDKIRASEHRVVNLSELIFTLTNDIICRAALGRKYHERELRGTISEYIELLGSFPVADYIPMLAWIDDLSGLNARFKRTSGELDDFLEGVLEEHFEAKRDGKKKDVRDFVDVLLSLDEKDENVGISLSRDNIKALILDVFGAGTDTTLNTMEWATAELLRNPQAMHRARQEVREVAGHSQKLTDRDTERMSFLRAIIKETLRLHPPVPLLLPRETLRDVKLGGFHIRAGTRVMVNAWAIGRDPCSWDGKPDEFQPERFLNSEVDFKGQHFQYIPFGAGRRICPGIGFAIPTIELTLANLLLHFDWEVPRDVEAEVLDVSEAPGITVHKKNPIMIKANPSLNYPCVADH